MRSKKAMSKATIQLPPFFLRIDGVLVEILEVTKSQLVTGESQYHIVLSIHYRGIKSRPYTLSIRDLKDLQNKLKIEITKLKFLEYSYGVERVRELIT